MECRTWQNVEAAIKDMVVRGAPAIGVSAAYGVVLAAQTGADLTEVFHGLARSRPTAVNLFWALKRMADLLPTTAERLEEEAKAIEQEDLEMCLAIGRHGNELVPEKATILTICNTGSLATAGHGTALGIIRSAVAAGKGVFVYSCETRPRQQGLRLTAYELKTEGIPFASIADSAAASLLASGNVDLVVAGADRIARNGDTANKVGTHMLAILAKHFGVPFYIAAPISTIDASLEDGTGIPIEERSAEELTHIEGIAVAPEDCPVWNPAFDVTPSELITAIVTEEGVFRPPYDFRS